MEMTLFYRGLLRSDGNATHKHEIRKVFAPQIRRRIAFLAAHQVIHVVTPGQPTLGFRAPITRMNERTAELNITFLRPSAPGNIVQGGDIDNRLKTLFDALRCPKFQELPEAALAEVLAHEQGPLGMMCCLLEDDSLISSVTVRTDRLLDVDPVEKPNEVVLIIQVSAVTHAIL